MCAKDSLTTLLHNGFKNCYLPHDDVLKYKVVEHVGCDSNIIEKDDEHLTIQLLFDDEQPIYNFILSKSTDNRLIIRDIVLSNT